MSEKSEATMEHVRRLYKESGLTLNEVGERMGYCEEHARKLAWQFLMKSKDPRLSMLVRFAEAMQLPLSKVVK